MNTTIFLDVKPCGSCKNQVSEERVAIIRVTRIGELETLAVTSNIVFLRSVMLLMLFIARRFLPP
jgi:hypothetical protein